VKKLVLPLLAVPLSLACTVGTSPVMPTKTAVPPSAAPDRPTPTAIKTALPSTPAVVTQPGEAAEANITVVELHLTGGSLPDQLAVHAPAAAALGQQPILYFKAEW